MLSRILSLHSRTQIRLLFPLTSQKIPKSSFFPHLPRHFSTSNNNGGDGGDPTSESWKTSQENDDLDDIFGTHDHKSNIPRGESPKVAAFGTEKSWGSEYGGGAGNGRDPTSQSWKMAHQNDDLDDIFSTHDHKSNIPRGESPKVGAFGVENSWGSEYGGGAGNGRDPTSESWKMAQENDDLDDIFSTHDHKSNIPRAVGESELGGGEEGFKPWKFGGEEEEEGKVEDVFEMNESERSVGDEGEEDELSKEEREIVAAAERLQLEKEEQSLIEAVKGPDRAFGDLIAASGITDAMLDSLIALKNFQDIEGLPPLTQIEDERYETTLKKSSRHEMELQKQEDAAKARVRKVDEKGRAYGTGKRKCSIARVWIQPGEGKFCINDKEFDVYFPMLDHRAALLRPFSETKTLGLWDVKCTVKGGGTTGQVDAIRLGVSRALQNWEPGLRPPLKEAGFLTRDPRIVERKKPGKAKARKSFQWVKR